jgi:hypothetical protein
MTHREITNTTQDMHRRLSDGDLIAVFEGLPNSIEASEAHGQRELVAAANSASAQLPTERRGVTDDELRVLGFEIGETVDGDPLFQRVRLPEGWRIEATGHSMHTRLVDPDGFSRADGPRDRGAEGRRRGGAPGRARRGRMGLPGTGDRRRRPDRPGRLHVRQARGVPAYRRVPARRRRARRVHHRSPDRTRRPLRLARLSGRDRS